MRAILNQIFERMAPPMVDQIGMPPPSPNPLDVARIVAEPHAPVVAAGWLPDPSGYRMRWWDGTRWTEHYAPMVIAAPPPRVSNPAATVSVVLAIVTVVVAFFIIPAFFTAAGGILSGIIGMVSARKHLVGMVTAAVGLTLCIVLLIMLCFAAFIFFAAFPPGTFSL